MTPIQAATITEALDSKDLMAKAGTGTGKTLAFLVPSINKLVSSEAKGQGIIQGMGLGLLVLSPTRELADQTATEARLLVKHLPGVQVQCVVGGTSIASDKKRLAMRPQILVATPGRLLVRAHT